MYPTNNFSSLTIRNVSSNSGSPTSIFDSSIIPNGGYAMILSIIISNKSTTSRGINMTLQKSGSANPAYMLYDVAIPTQSAFEVMNGNKFVINKGDSLRAWVDGEGNNMVDLVISYVVYSPAS